MSTITNDDVQRLAMLSNITLNDTEVEALRTDIGNILTYVEQLSELDTADIEPTYQVTGLENVWRDDTVDDGGALSADLVALATEQQDNQVKVPQVL
jgi:aspartyl-tRNA(Asn)/glutamyl-tRNA(Gln) amidotransferase subunit C